MEKKKLGFLNRKLIVIVFFILYILISLIITRAEYLQIKEIGEQYVSIYYTNIVNKYIVMAVSFVISYIVIFLSNKKMRKSLSKFFEEEKKEMPKLPNKSISFIASLIVSFVAQIFLTEKFLMFTHSAQFGIADPIFNFDIAFYMFKLPFIKALLLFVIIFMVLLTVYSIIYYIVTINVYLDGIDRETLTKNSYIKHIISNIIIIAILVAGMVVLASHEVVTGSMMTLEDEAKTEIVGAGLTDVKIKVWGYRILAAMILISVIRVIKYLKVFKVKKIVSSMLIVPIYLVTLFVVMTGFQYIYAERNELDKQKNYLSDNLNYTRQAYNINVEEVDVENKDEDIKIDSNFLENVTVVSKDSTLASLEEYKDSEGYYTYKSSVIGLYNVDGKKQPLYITPREIVSGANRTYTSKTYQYTHGYGVVASDVSNLDETGNTKYIQYKYDNSDNKLNIKEPRIYFGLTTDETIVTNANDKKEFDYPISTKDYEENEYNGEAGIKANMLDRVVLAIEQHNWRLALSSDISENSRILMNRNIRERAKTLMPYLIYDENPYMVVTDDGRLVWVLDAYTRSNKYPYSQKTKIKVEDNYEEINYIRNSVKVLVDAYDGTIDFYITDRTDPIVMLYRNLYPDLFKEKDVNIPEDIQKNIVYPEYLYDIQAKMLERYHNVNTEILYRNDDVWSAAKTVKGEETYIKPTYTMMKVPDSDTEELGLVISYNKLNKQSLNSYLVGKYDNGNKLTIYKLSPDSNLPGIKQLKVQIEQDELIAEELSKINTPGTEMIYNTFIVPIGNKILYVEPVYQILINEESNVPMLKKVIVASEKKVAIGNSLKEALINLISDSAYDLEFINQDSQEELIEAIIKANNNLKQSSEANDWEMIGNDLNDLQSLIEKLEKLKNSEESEDNKDNEENKGFLQGLLNQNASKDNE